jgi:Ran GTPase-activating protein (RanGAP) involved in mRNA processing and transport
LWLRLRRILAACNEKNNDIRRLKISKINLNDDKIVDQLCNIIEKDRNLTSIDLSWGSLGPKHLLKICESLKDSKNALMNINLSYNSLCFIEPTNDQKEMFFNSEDFFQELCDFLEETKNLVHLDLSGLSFQREQLTALCAILVNI